MSRAKYFERREMLKLMSLLGSRAVLNPMCGVAASIVQGFVQKAAAADMGYSPRNMLSVLLQGGKPRWTYDLFLTPYSSANWKRCRGVNTRYVAVNGRYEDVAYETVPVKGINAPWMWQFNVPTARGGQRPMSDLLDHMLAIQGLDALANGHNTAGQMLATPLGSLQSLTALPSDYSNAPIKAVGLSFPYIDFRSKHGYEQIFLGQSYTKTGNWIRDLMDPFVAQASSSFKAKKEQLKSAIELGSAALSAQASSDRAGASAALGALKDAKDLMAGALLDFDAVWPALVDKYKNLQKKALLSVLPGVNDLPVGTQGTRGKDYAVGYFEYPTNQEDLRTMITEDSLVGSIAEEFALAEFLFTNNLSQSCQMILGDLYGTHGAVPNSPLTFGDDHNNGVMFATIGWIFNYRAYSTCLLEFIDVMKAAGKWNDTLVMTMGEFGRAANQTNGSGHDRYASNVTFHSGAIQGPHVVGSLLSEDPENLGWGTWGTGTSRGTGLNIYDYGHLIVSVARMLRVPSPLTARDSLVSEQGGVILPLLEKTRIIA